MKSAKSKNVVRGWARGSNRYPAKRQAEALAKAGVEMVYSSENDETTADLCRGLVGGEHLYVVGTHRLGATRAEYTAVLEHCRKMRVTIHDLERGTEHSAEHLAAALAVVADDLREIAGEARLDAVRLAEKHGKVIRRGRQAKGHVSKAEAERIWKDVENVLTDAEAAELSGYARRTLFSWFGSSGRKAGWPQRKK